MRISGGFEEKNTIGPDAGSPVAERRGQSGPVEPGEGGISDRVREDEVVAKAVVLHKLDHAASVGVRVLGVNARGAAKWYTAANKGVTVMLFRSAITAVVLSSACFSASAQDQAAKPTMTLTKAEAAAGWKVLFDGTNTDAWRGYRRPTFPSTGWKIEDGTLRVVAGGGGGDIITREQYGDFELELEFKVAPKANSGIMYLVSERHGASWQSGPEFQVLDDAGHNLKADHPHSAGALYDMYTPAAGKKARAAGEWNQVRIRHHNGVLQHWLNGVKVVEAVTTSEEWKQRIAGSKFKEYAGFGVLPKGHIALQEHGDDVWYRNIRVRDLAAPMLNEKALFDGQSLAGWTAHLNDGGKLEDVWSVEDGVLTCKGNPVGYIRTTERYTSYVLKLEWRFPGQPGNSGVLCRVQEPDTVWPKSIEAQLHSGNAGDFWNIGEFAMKADPSRTNGRNTKATHRSERPLGEWNAYEIIVDGPTVVLKVNGEELNRATECAAIPGFIALQSEGAPIQFRRIRLAPLE